MKEKRYYCDWYLSNRRNGYKICFICTMLITITSVVGGWIFYRNLMYHYGDALEAYSESDYEYLEKIPDRVIGKDGIHEVVIPDDIVIDDINYQNDKIIVKYSLDNNKGNKYVTSASITVTLSKDFKVLDQKRNYSSKEEYVQKCEMLFWDSTFAFGLLIWIVMCIVCCGIVVVAFPISKMHKQRNEKNFHKKC